MVKEKYYANISKREIHQHDMIDQGEYEVTATPEQIVEINKLFLALEDDSTDAVKFLAKPFNESKVDDKRDKYDDDLINLYSLIYKLGTSYTKEKIDELNLF